MPREASTDVALITGGKAYGGWKRIRVQRGMQQCAGQFALNVSELWPGAGEARTVQPGESCELLIGSEPVIKGYVDQLEVGMDAEHHEVTVTGRDATADLVDCSAVRKAGQWRGQKIEAIAKELAEPFGIKVTADVDTGKPLTSFALQLGETVFEAIERAARIRALLLVSDGAGGLLITRAGGRRVGTPLVLGRNVKSARAVLDMRDRFSDYVMIGQAPGSDFFSGTQVSQVRALASDSGVPRYRPLIITSDAPDLAATLKERALWEANVRAARSMQVEVVVNGWRHDGGLWAPNMLVPVRMGELRLDDELLITACEYSLDEAGQMTRLALTRSDAFSLLPVRSQPGGGFVWDRPAKAAGATQ